MKPIERNNPIFKSPALLKDAALFNVLFSIIENKEKYPEIRCFSEDKECVIVNSDRDHPVIVWTSDYFNDYQNVYAFVKEEFKDNKPLSIYAKESFLNALRTFEPIQNEMTENVYTCQDLNKIQYTGYSNNIKSDEVARVAKLLSYFYEETGLDVIQATPKDLCNKNALDFIDNPLCRVWRNSEDKIVTLGRITLSEDSGRVGCIVTDPEERGKSYAKMLVHSLTAQILKEGKKAVIFADANYVSSNKCYQAVGYKLAGKISVFPILMGKEKER